MTHHQQAVYAMIQNYDNNYSHSICDAQWATLGHLVSTCTWGQNPMEQDHH